MKKAFTVAAAVVCMLTILSTLCCCAIDGATLLAQPASAEALRWEERQSESVKNIIASSNDFAFAFSDAVYGQFGEEGSFAVAPVSVYMALSLAAECAEGETRAELLNALGLTYDGLKGGFAALYGSLTAEYKDDNDETAGMLELSDSVWMDDRAHVKDACINALADKYYCYPYQVDFDGDNKGANRAIREFVKKHTHGLIDQDFLLSADTLFALINALYLKDVWNDYGGELSFEAGQYSFVNGDGSVASVPLLGGYYKRGRAVQTETYRHFFTQTEHGYTLKFIVPNDGYSVADVFNAETLDEVNNIEDYRADDKENKIHYSTRCVFPEFETKFDKDVRGVLENKFGVRRLFDPSLCDFSALTDDAVYCYKVQHVTDLKVDKTGIEGAAVTIMADAESAGPDGWADVNEDFVVDRAFGFVLTDRFGTVIFCGVVDGL